MNSRSYSYVHSILLTMFNPNVDIIRAATNSYYGWTDITALAFYGRKEDVQNYLTDACTDTENKVQVAKDTQALTKNTMIGKNFTAYGLINYKCSILTGWAVKKFIIGETITKEDYFKLLMQHLGLFAIHQYLENQINLKGITHNDCQERIIIFSRMLSALLDDSHDSLMNVLNCEIPTGYFSTEFYDLLTSFKSLPYDEMQNHFAEYKKHIVSLGNSDMSSLEKISFKRIHISKQTLTYYLGSNKDRSSLFSIFPRDVNNVITANMLALESQGNTLKK